MLRFNDRSVFKFIALAACAFPALPVIADATEPEGRPRIGLVLAGGGAKGGAHVGVLKVLEELKVPVDCIAGTSMGALIGAGYAAGQPAADLESFINGIDWSTIVGGKGRRALKPVEANRLATDTQSELKVGLKEGRIVTPAGLVDTSNIDDLLRTYVAQARMVNAFDELPIPFRAVATDMVSGEMVVLDQGDLATAMRASMAIPGAFSPVPLNGMVLADGGMVRNIPVDVARSMCADIVIVVNLVEPPATAEKLVQATQLLSRSMDVMFEVNEKIQLQSLTERDVRIDVPMGDITTSDFERVPETIPLGEAAARAASERLAVYALPAAEYTAWRQHATASKAEERRIADVKIEGLNWVGADYLESLSTVRAGDTVDIDAISRDARHMAALDELEAVAYRLEGEADETTLVWLPTEATIGKDYLSPSLGVYADGGGDLKFQLSVQHVRRWLNERGAQWRNTLEIGYETSISTSLYQPFDVAQHFFVEPELFAGQTLENLFIDGDHVATVEFRDLGGRLDFGWNLRHAAQLRLGYWASDRRASVQTGPPGVSAADDVDAGLTFAAHYDSRDTASFATTGMSAAVEYYQSDESLGADRNWERIEAGARKAVPFGKNLMWVSLAGGTAFGDDLPGDRGFSLGGPRTLAGYQFDEIRVQSYWLAQGSFLWRVKDLVTIKNQALYAGFGVYAAGLYDRFDLTDDEEIYGASAYLAGSTPIGAINLGVGYSSGNSAIWLSIGKPVGRGSILDDGLFR
jgi:NTE family protein